MKITIIKNKKEYETILSYVDELFDKKVKKGSPEGDQLELLLLVVKDYEDKHYPIKCSDSIEAIKLYMEEKNMNAKDLIPFIGSKSYVSQILNKKKPLTAAIMKILYQKLGIPAEILLAA